jgi:hypothetical protein
MYIIKLPVLFVALLLVIPAAALSWEEVVEVQEVVEIEALEESSEDTVILKDERVLELEESYSEELQAIVKEIEGEPDALKRERLQKEASLLKADEEIAMKDLLLQIAVEQGDEDRIAELEEAINLLYEPRQAVPAEREERRPPDSGSVITGNTAKNPDGQ